jgi:hypothetical protein
MPRAGAIAVLYSSVIFWFATNRAAERQRSGGRLLSASSGKLQAKKEREGKKAKAAEPAEPVIGANAFFILMLTRR